MDNSEKISIIVPIYNAEKTLERCIKSLINQSYKNIEIILINDGSSDRSLNICNTYRKVDKRIKVITQNNMGVSLTRNNGIENSTGAYIGFIDADDFINEKYYEKLHNEMTEKNADLAICNYNIIYNKRDERIKSNSSSFVIDSPEEYHKNIKIYNGFLWNKLFKRSIIGNLRLDKKIHYCEDELFVTQYVEKCNLISYISEPLYNYCIQRNSGSSWLKWNEKKVTVISAKIKIIETLKKYEFNVYKQYYLDLFLFYNEIYHRFDRNIDYKNCMKEMYRKIKLSTNYTIKEKINVMIRYNFYDIYNFVRILYHKND